LANSTTRTNNTADLQHLRAALALAARGLGRVWPNPAVGAIVVDREGIVAGRGVTGRGGRPHAETIALDMAGARAHGGTLYVTLEPCAHHGQTPPCAAAIIAAGIKRCVAAIGDPDPRVNGRGVAQLRAAGIEVMVGLLNDEAYDLNAGFFLRTEKKRPLIGLKLATSLDGRIALANGQSQWITGTLARDRGHLLRAEYDAVLVGTNTALLDNPALTCRLPGRMEDSPVRVLLDRTLRLPMNARMIAEARQVPTWLMTRPGHAADSLRVYRDAGVKVVEIPEDSCGRLDIAEILTVLAGQGITRLLVEGGGALAGAFLEKDLVDRLYWFRAAMLIGGDGAPGVGALSATTLAQAPRFRLRKTIPCAPDVLEIYDCAR